MKKRLKQEFVLLTGICVFSFHVALSARPADPPSGSRRWIVDCRSGVKGIKLSIRLPAGREGAVADTAPAAHPAPTLVHTVTEGINEEALKACCEKLATEKRRIYYLNDRRNKMVLCLKGIYTREEAVFLQIFLRNYSNIDYPIDKIGLYVTDPGQNGKEERQMEIYPLFVYGNARLVRGKGRELCVFALPRFTLPRGKRLVIDVSEKNGGRHLQLRMDNYTLLKARLI